MIKYSRDNVKFLLLFRIEGSVFKYSLLPSILTAALGMLIRVTIENWEFFSGSLTGMMSSNAYSSVSVLVGFLIIFRSNHAYNRFWDGSFYVREMQAEFYVTGSNLFAFCRQAKAPKEAVVEFEQKLIRLLSFLNAVALNSLHGGTSEYFCQEVIDMSAFDGKTLRTINDSGCKVELVVQWLQALTVDAQTNGVLAIAPPILSRIFQNLSNGLTAYYSAHRMTEIPYPFPYMQTTEWLLACHLLFTPIAMCAITKNMYWTGVLSFLIALILISLNQIAVQLEDPFGSDVNDLNLHDLQDEMNQRLLMLCHPATRDVPRLRITPDANNEECLHNVNLRDLMGSLNDKPERTSGSFVGFFKSVSRDRVEKKNTWRRRCSEDNGDVSGSRSSGGRAHTHIEIPPVLVEKSTPAKDGDEPPDRARLDVGEGREYESERSVPKELWQPGEWETPFFDHASSCAVLAAVTHVGPEPNAHRCCRGQMLK